MARTGVVSAKRSALSNLCMVGEGHHWVWSSQGQEQLQRLHSDLMDDAIDHLARSMDHVDDREQARSVARQYG